MIRIYVDYISPQVEYAFDFIFGSRGLAYTLTEEDEGQIDLRYAGYLDTGTGTIEKASFMEDLDFFDPEIGFDKFGSTECYSFDGTVDPIGAIFYTLTRSEEYGRKHADEYGRFPFSKSVIPKEWLMQAMCDRWAEEVISMINPNLIQKQHEVTIVPTFDIDNSYAYKLKSGKRKWMSIAKDLARFDFKRLNERRAVLAGRSDDPYDTFDKIRSIQKRFPATKVFWLIGKWGKKDRNISIHNSEHQKLIRSLSDEGISVGLHPSFGSFKKEEVISGEKKELESVCGKEIHHSRHHFLRFRVPDTYRDLTSVGFTDEYSMGFAEHIGFRSGTARPHKWFDLASNRSTELTIHPFAYMDGTLREYMKLSPEEGKTKIRQLYDEVKRYGGDFIFIWHNETIGDYGNWKGWSEVLDFTLSLSDESN